MALAQLVALGVDRHAVSRRVADGRLRPLHRGVYAVGPGPLTPQGTWMAAVLACGLDAVLSHRDAAALWDLRPSHRSSVDVTVPGAHRRSRKRITVHRNQIEPQDRTARDGIPVTSLARTLLDLAAVVDAKQVQRAFERAERLHRLDVGAIERVLGRSNGHRGTGILRALLGYDPTAAAEAVSELERLFLDLVRDAGLPTPQVNVLVEGYLVDAYWPRARLVVELQGYSFHSGQEVFERDHEKLAALRLAGIDVLPLTHKQVTRKARATAMLLARLLEPDG